jgi:membrane protease YdiL (CAAX protease family)
MAQSKLKPWHGLMALAFVAAMTLYVFAGVQGALGVTGLVLTELFIAAVAVAGVFAFGGNRSDLFPVAKIKPRHAVGSVALWAGAFFLVLAVGSAMQILFPSMAESVSYVSEFVGSEGFWMAVIVPSVFAGVCEELLHRGLVLSSFKKMRPDWLKVLVMGALFGAFHLDPFRFLTTAILGGVFAFVVMRTGNILIAMFLHTLNDLIGFLVLYLARGILEGAAAQPQAGAGWANVGVLLAIAAIPLAIGGALMRKGKSQEAEEQQTDGAAAE